MVGLDPELLTLCPSKTILFDCIDNGALGFERIETAEQVADRLLAAAPGFRPADGARCRICQKQMPIPLGGKWPE